MKPVKTEWNWSLETEARRIIHCAYEMANGFFRVNNFYVVPPESKANSPLTVAFPNLPYHSIPRFWEKCKQQDVFNFPLNFDPELVKATSELLANSNLSAPDRSTVEKTWEKTSGPILETIGKLIPDKANAISKIIIHYTRFGTTVSFSVASKFPTPVEMHLRDDQDIWAITEAILTAITRREVYDNLSGLWSESELLVDWLLMRSALTPVLKKFQPISTFIPTVKYTRMKQSANLMKISEEYYRKLGVPVLDKVFGIKNDAPTITGKVVENLTPREIQILKLLIENNNSVVEIDKLSDIIFNEGEEFSLWAIAKVVQRLRDKLEQNGVSGSFIQTLRGQGYILKN